VSINLSAPTAAAASRISSSRQNPRDIPKKENPRSRSKTLVLSTFNSRLKGLRISQISSQHVGKLIKFEGTILQASKVKSRLVKAAFQCSRCGSIKFKQVGIWDSISKVAKSLTCDSCRKAEAKYEFEFLEELSEFANFQELLIQEPIEISKDGRQHSISVFIENCEGIFSGMK
jgi:replicative DNA helicase Mcm